MKIVVKWYNYCKLKYSGFFYNYFKFIYWVIFLLKFNFVKLFMFEIFKILIFVGDLYNV